MDREALRLPRFFAAAQNDNRAGTYSQALRMTLAALDRTLAQERQNCL